MRVLCLFDGVTGVGFHRLYTPYSRLQVDEGITVDVSMKQSEWGDLEYKNYDCVVFNRWLGNLQYNILPILAKHKIPYIVDLDDYWVLPKHNPAYKFYRAYIKNGIKDALHYADGVSVTTPQLLEKAKEFYKGDNIQVIPNALDLNQSQWKANKDHRPTIGWVGGLSHTEDLKLLQNQIKEVCEAYGWRFLMCGFHENTKEWASMEKSITGESRANRPEWFETITGTSADKYGTAYAEIDIALAPLTKTHFNKHKSELKIVEAAAYKLPILVSDVEPYTNHRNNLGVYFVSNNDWVSPLSRLIESGKWKQIGGINYKYCQEHHNLKEINKKRLALLKSVTS